MDEIKFKETNKNALEYKKEKVNDLDVEVWNWHQNETGQQQGPAPKNVVKLPQAGNLVIEAPEAEEVHLEDRPEYIGFDAAYTQVTDADSDLMASIRQILKTYMDKTEEYQNGQANLSGMDKQAMLTMRLQILSDLQGACAFYRNNRHPFFLNTFGKKRKREVIALEEKVKEERDRVSKEFLSHMENEFTRLAGTDPMIRKREFREGQDKYAPKEIQLKGNQLNMDPFAYRTFTDSEQSSIKQYLALKVEQDAKRTDVAFSREEKALLKKIGEYAQIIDIGRSIGKAAGSFFGNSSLIKRQKQEGKLFKEIMQELNERIESEQSADKKRILEKYLTILQTDTQGTLVVPADAQVKDFTNITAYKYSKPGRDLTGNNTFYEQPAEIVDRKEEPIFAHPPCVSDVIQKSIGDCFLLSSLAELVADDPKVITSIFHEEPDGNVVVKLFHHFFTGPDREEEHFEPVYFKMDKKVSARSNSGALWVNMLCKAYMLYLDTFTDISLRTEGGTDRVQALRERKQGRQNVADYGMIHGGVSFDVFPVFTGKQSKLIMLNTPEPKLQIENPAFVVGTNYLETHDRQESKNKLADGSIFDEEFAMINDNAMVYFYHKDPIHNDFLASEQDAKKRSEYFRDYAMCASSIAVPFLKAKAPADVIKYYEEIKAQLLGLNDTNRVEAMIRGDQHAGPIFDSVLTRSQQPKEVLIQKMMSDSVRLIDEAIQKYPMLMARKEIFSGEYTKDAEDLFDKITEMRGKGTYVAASSKKGKSNAFMANAAEKGMVTQHEYAILGTKEVTYNGKTIKMLRLRNPWGHYTVSYRKNKKGKVEAYEGKATGDNGEFLMELNHFLKEYVWISVGANSDKNPLE